MTKQKSRSTGAAGASARKKGKQPARKGKPGKGSDLLLRKSARFERVLANVTDAVKELLVTLTKPAVLIRITEVVGNASGRAPADVMPDWVLRDAPLRFGDNDVMGLTAPLNQKFADVDVQLTIAQVGITST